MEQLPSCSMFFCVEKYVIARSVSDVAISW